MTVKTLPTGKNKKVIRLIVIRRGFRAKTYSYLTFITMTMKKLRSRGNNKKDLHLKTIKNIFTK